MLNLQKKYIKGFLLESLFIENSTIFNSLLFRKLANDFKIEKLI